MTLDQLKYFYEASRFQHIGKAARFIHISPSAISTAIAALESELGCRLFERIGKSIVLTEAGRKLKGEAERLFDQVSGIKSRISGETGELRGNYRIGGSHFLAAHVLTRAWSQLLNTHPELTGEITAIPTGQVLREVLNGTLDLGLCFSPIQHPDLEQIPLHQGQLRVAVRPGHPLLKIKKGLKTLQELSRFSAALHKGLPGVELCEAHPIFSQYQVTPEIRLSFDDDQCAIERVTTSDSWTLIPDIVLHGNSRRLKEIPHPAKWEAPYSVNLVFRRDRKTNPVIHALMLALKDQLQA